MKRVTVVIPMYGVEQYIAATVQSVLDQTHTNFELILVDDGSPDRSVEICRQFADPRIRILQQPNSGPAAARNLGIRHATGDYIAFLDGDDLWTTDKLAQHVDHLERSPQVGVSFCRSALIDEDSQPLGIYQVVTQLDNISVMDLLCRTPIGNGSVPVIRRETLEAIQFTPADSSDLAYFNPDRQIHPSEDVECWVRISTTTGWTIAGIPAALTLYRVNSRGFSANLLKKLQSWEHMLAAAKGYAPDQIGPCESAAMAYQLRHLARRAVTLRDGGVAVQLIHRALALYGRMLLEEPQRTLQTLIAAYLVWMLPSRFYQACESSALRVAGLLQKQRIVREAGTARVAPITPAADEQSVAIG